ncbi:MAG: GGDEF domain-containing protein [Hafnia sp.]|uniref:GGDEF domain-containing protein n=1 Tax=Hafnia TaxID=568 RepID=UPI002FCAC080
MSSDNFFFRLISRRQDVVTVMLFVISAACFTLFYYKTETTVNQIEFLLKLSNARSDFISLAASSFNNMEDRVNNEQLKESERQALQLSYSSYIKLLHEYNIPEKLKESEEITSNKLLNHVISAKGGNDNIIEFPQNTQCFRILIEESLCNIESAFHWKLILLIMIPFLISIVRTLHGLYYIDVFEKLNKDYYIDYLTKAYNRRYIPKIKKHNKLNYVLAIDIDNFKHINDSYGHDIGDKALYKCTKIMQRNIKASDIVVRMGGDEFLVFLFNASLQDAKHITTKILQDINGESLYISEQVTAKMTVSVGVAEFTDDISTTMKLADVNLYESKSRGKKQFTF